MSAGLTVASAAAGTAGGAAAGSSGTGSLAAAACGDVLKKGFELQYEPGKTIATRAGGARWTRRYDENGTVTSIADQDGAEKLRVTDDRGLVIKEIDSGGRVTERLYDDSGHHHARRNRWGQLLPPLDELPNPPNPLAVNLPSTHWGQQVGGSLESLRPLVSLDTFPPQGGRCRTIGAQRHGAPRP